MVTLAPVHRFRNRTELLKPLSFEIGPFSGRPPPIIILSGRGELLFAATACRSCRSRICGHSLTLSVFGRDEDHAVCAGTSIVSEFRRILQYGDAFYVG